MPLKIRKHSKLGLSFAEFGALLGTRTMLANNAIVDAKGKTGPVDDKHSFNMEITCKTQGCGSAACIGGTMAQIMGHTADQTTDYVYDADDQNRPIKALFFPPVNYDYGKITRAHAVKAIDNFLATGKPLWTKILPNSAKEKL